MGDDNETAQGRVYVSFTIRSPCISYEVEVIDDGREEEE
jgi:hypothetical protein